MYNYQTAGRPQNNPYFTAAMKTARWPDSSTLSREPAATAGSAARTDMQIEQDVRDELETESTVRAAAIGIEVSDGIVTLTGVVDGDGERWLAESAARRIAGVKGVVARLKTFTPDIIPVDDDIAHDCERVLERLTPKADYAIGVTVSHGWVTLSGNVAEGYERGLAETEVGSLLSVHGVNSQVRVRSNSAASGKSEQHELKSGNYEFTADNDRITWPDVVLSWTQHRDMLYAAWSSLRAKRA